MMRRAARVTVAAVALAFVAAGVAAPPASAHAGDRAQLHLAAISAMPAGPGRWMLHVAVVDADSGRPAPGFRVVVSGQGRSGAFGPVDMEDPTASGRYETAVTASSGRWSVTVKADQAPGGDPAVPLASTTPVEFPAGAASSTPGAAGPAMESSSPTPSLLVRLERGGDQGPSTNWVSLRAVITDRTTGQGQSDGLEVYATATMASGEEAEAVAFGPTGQPGVFSGFSIVPRGGHWRFTAVVNRKRPDGDRSPPVTYAKASLDADVVAGNLQTPGPGAVGRGVKANGMEAAVLWLHSLLALAWFGLIVVLALGFHPRTRRLLTERGASLLDARATAVVRAAGWCTVGVVATGLYNIARSTPYRAPLTPTRWHQVTALPYGRPYYTVLVVKIALYTVMIVAAVPVISRARRVAGAWLAPPPVVDREEEPDVSPWGTGSPTAVKTARAKAPAVVASADDRRSRFGPEVIIAAGAVGLTMAVTLLKYLHLLSETTRR